MGLMRMVSRTSLIVGILGVATAAAQTRQDFGRDKVSGLVRDLATGHLIFLATSTDGLTWQEQETPTLVKCSSADVIELDADCPAGPKGALCLYFMDGTKVRGAGDGQLSRCISTDNGKLWSEPEPLFFDGISRKVVPNNPSVVKLDDGRLRIYCDIYVPPRTPKDDPTRVAIGSFTSRDGVRFVLDEGYRYEGSRIGDPAVLKVGSEWIMLVAHRDHTRVARSADGLEFKLDESIKPIDGNTPGGIALDGDSLRTYTCRSGGAILSGVLHLRTGEFTPDEGTRVVAPALDPAVIRRSDGSYLMALRRWRVKLP